MDGIGLIPIVVGLDQEPITLRELIQSMHFFAIPLYDCSFIAFSSREDKVDRRSYFLSLESLQCPSIGGLLIGDLLH